MIPPAPFSTQTRFFGRLALFWAPVIILVLAAEAALYQIGENWTVERVIHAEPRLSSSLFLRGIFDQQLHLYKMKALARKSPEIVALGSSRVMQIRAEMFGAAVGQFYNAGGLLQRLADLEDLLRRYPDFKPRVAILGIDVWWFNEGLPENALQAKTTSASRLSDAALSWEAHLTALRSLLRPGGLSVLQLALHPRPNRLGLKAQQADMGFRADGSMAYSLPSPPPVRYRDQENPPVVERIRQRQNQFRSATGLSSRLLASLRESLMEMKRRGILVVGFLPPFSSEVIQALRQSPDHCQLWYQFQSQLPALFDELNLPLVDASSPQYLALDDRYLYDGFHAMETFQLYLLKKMWQHPAVQVRLPGLGNSVERLLQSSSTDVWRVGFWKSAP